MSTFVYVGTYTTENKKKNRNACGEGISVYAVNEKSEWTLIQTVPQLNPAVLAFGQGQKYLYCVNTNSNEISAFSRDNESGMLTYINSKPTSGVNCMVLSVSPNGSFICVGDHTGLISLFPCNTDGSIGDEKLAFQLPGEKGPLNEKIQPWSRPHHVPFTKDGKFVLAADKGLDLVHSYHMTNIGTLEPVEAIKCRPAACPRHIAFHPLIDVIYVNMEFTSMIMACRMDYQTGKMEPFQIVPSLPEDWVGTKNMTSEIEVHPNGKTLYISNRGHESIGVFDIDKFGKLSPKQWVSCCGVKPRFFALEPGGKLLYCGNQKSNTIKVFSVADDGTLSNPVQTIETPCPVWILFTGEMPTPC